MRKVVSETYMLLKSKSPTTLQSLSLYLANKDTEYILFKPVKVSQVFCGFLCACHGKQSCKQKQYSSVGNSKLNPCRFFEVCLARIFHVSIFFVSSSCKYTIRYLEKYFLYFTYNLHEVLLAAFLPKDFLLYSKRTFFPFICLITVRDNPFITFA